MPWKVAAQLARLALPALAIAACPALALADPANPAALPPGENSASEDYALHAQATFVVQGVTGFTAPYSGANSLAPRQIKETLDVTLFAGARPWRGAELWINPEIDQGFGLSDTLGVAGFPSAEAYKVGKASPYLRLQRLFLRQTIGLGGGQNRIAGAANQLAGTQDRDRLVLTLGKFSVADMFDTNRYAHDPRGDFLNWAVVDTGTFDYAADAWGYSYGAAAELYRGDWTVRTGLFNLSRVPNGEVLEHDFSQHQLVGELEHRHTLAGQPGAVRITGFRNSGRFSRYDEAAALAQSSGQPIDLARTRRRMTRLGIAFNAEQALTGNLGLFMRAGLSDGAIEPYDFTDIDRTAGLGATLGGAAWGRANDTAGLAIVDNAISGAHKQFLAAGGIGVLVGDGRLPHPGDERIIEADYTWRPAQAFAVTLDYQHIANPGYNRDRGPANVFGVRLHAGI